MTLDTLALLLFAAAIVCAMWIFWALWKFAHMSALDKRWFNPFVPPPTDEEIKRIKKWERKNAKRKRKKAKPK